MGARLSSRRAARYAPGLESEALKAAIDAERPAAVASFDVLAVDVPRLRALIRRAEALQFPATAAGARFLLAEIGRAKRRQSARLRRRKGGR